MLLSKIVYKGEFCVACTTAYIRKLQFVVMYIIHTIIYNNYISLENSEKIENYGTGIYSHRGVSLSIALDFYIDWHIGIVRWSFLCFYSTGYTVYTGESVCQYLYVYVCVDMLFFLLYLS